MAMVLIDAGDAAARVRAAMAYADIDVKDSEERVGIGPATMARIMSPTTPRGASIDELRQIAHACGVPEGFMEQGFEALAAVDQARRIDELASGLEALTRRVEELGGEGNSP